MFKIFNIPINKECKHKDQDLWVYRRNQNLFYFKNKDDDFSKNTLSQMIKDKRLYPITGYEIYESSDEWWKRFEGLMKRDEQIPEKSKELPPITDPDEDEKKPPLDPKPEDREIEEAEIPEKSEEEKPKTKKKKKSN